MDTNISCIEAVSHFGVGYRGIFNKVNIELSANEALFCELCGIERAPLLQLQSNACSEIDLAQLWGELCYLYYTIVHKCYRYFHLRCVASSSEGDSICVLCFAFISINRLFCTFSCTFVCSSAWETFFPLLPPVVRCVLCAVRVNWSLLSALFVMFAIFIFGLTEWKIAFWAFEQ